jgi:predicted transcriptional regulator
MISVAGTMSAISDDKALSLFKAVALSESDCSNILITKLRLTRRQYYSIMTRLMRADLVRRISGKYSLTSLGKVIFYSYVKIEDAIKCYWKLKAVDSILMSANAELPAEECQRIIDNLIDNNEIKAVLISNNICESQCYATSEQKQQEQQQRRHSRQLKELLIH